MMMRSTCAAVAALGMFGVAQAGFIDLEGGWRAQWDDSLDGLVEISDDGVVDGVQFIQKSAEFLEAPPQPGAEFPAIVITFFQLEVDAVERFGILDEVITNSTGVDWTDFHMEVQGMEGTKFNPDLTATSGGSGPIGFSISPFTNAAFADSDTRLNIDGGVVPTGTQWRPGSGAEDGILYIDTPTIVARGGSAPSFDLIERPTPTPGAAGALALLGIAGARRRRGH